MLNWACSWPDNEWVWPEWDSNQGLPSYEPSGQIDLKPKALLSGDTMYIMHDIMLYVWQLHYFNYFKRFKIVLYIIFNENLFADFLSIFRDYWLKSGDVLSWKFPNLAAILDFCQLG